MYVNLKPSLGLKFNAVFFFLSFSVAHLSLPAGVELCRDGFRDISTYILYDWIQGEY